MMYIAITPRSGPVAIMLVIDGADIEVEISKAGIDAVSWREIQPSEVPATRSYREAWVDRGARIDVDLPRARNVCRARLRAMRAPLLATLDTEYIRADERGDAAAKNQIAARKQALRDAPADPRIERAATPTELDAVTAAIINANRVV
jgi:hypothetical protein